MKISLISGGRGSTSLQKEFHKLLGFVPDNIINLYDDGKSTGLIRKMYHVLGPSDLRKCQFVKAEIEESIDSRVLELLSSRVTGNTEEIISCYKRSSDEIYNITQDEIMKVYLKDAVDLFALCYKESTITDVPLANILYGYLFSVIGSDNTEMIMRRFLNINSKVLLNSNRYAELVGLTSAGRILRTEEQIVDLNDSEDRIIDISLKSEYPINTTMSTLKAINDQDIIVISPGTVWSSILPTFKTIGFTETMAHTSARIYLVINSNDDGDTKGFAYEDYASLYAKQLGKLYSKLIIVPENTEDIASYILRDYVARKLTGKTIVASDFDGTLTEDSYKDFAVTKISKYIITGNVLPSNVDVTWMDDIYFNMGLESYRTGMIFYKHKIDEEVLQNISNVVASHTDKANIQILSRQLIRIKPIECRNELLHKIKEILPDNYDAAIRGETSIEVFFKGVSKISHFMTRSRPFNLDREILYIGDEPNGNDKEAMEIYDHMAINNIVEAVTIFKLMKEIKNGN